MTQQQNDRDVKPGGRTGGASEDELGPIGNESATPGPMGPGGGGEERGPGANGSLATGTYNERGDLTGPDSADARIEAREGQGDDLADRLGGGEGRGAGMTGAGAASGDMRADRSEAGDDAPDLVTAVAGGPDAGSPGGMGGARTRDGAGTGGRPPGGVSPMQGNEEAG